MKVKPKNIPAAQTSTAPVTAPGRIVFILIPFSTFVLFGMSGLMFRFSILAYIYGECPKIFQEIALHFLP
jgi:hypothetical protein